MIIAEQDISECPELRSHGQYDDSDGNKRILSVFPSLLSNLNSITLAAAKTDDVSNPFPRTAIVDGSSAVRV